MDVSKRMTKEEFTKNVTAITKKCMNLLFTHKSYKYSDNDDLFYNFKKTAEILETTPEKALLGMLVEKEVRMFKIVDNIKNITPEDHITEVITDMINYLILLQLLIQERIMIKRLSIKSDYTQMDEIVNTNCNDE